ncbi:symplekin isoform X2 [Bacillus rossius redtenbacheri]|uniref:symplekin isoform X2 n=1 Tax=Bacillus rossius redtenbacheri TaxID=93214 RepID=UPI002FDDBB0F
MTHKALDSRRSTAAQFFLQDNEELSSSYNKIVEWLNQASLSSSDNSKMEFLRKVQEIIINKDASLLDNFLDEVLGFQNDRSADVRKTIVGFIEEAIKKDPDVLPKVITNLAMLLEDPSVQVQKRVIQAAGQVYRCTLVWLSRVKNVTEEMEAAWSVMNRIKASIVNKVDSDNDGIRTHSVKFLERVVLTQTYPTPDSMHRENDLSLEDIPLTLKVARRRKLEEEANMVFELLLKFHSSPHISSVNLMTCMGSLTLIAKMRPQFMGRVIAALETLHTNLPPTLSKSQVSSVRKHLKIQLLNLLKHPSSVDYHTNITTLLTDLGATYQEVMKYYPKPDEVRKRQKRLAAESLVVQAVVAKRPRVEAEGPQPPEEQEAAVSVEDAAAPPPPPSERAKKQTEVTLDLMEQFIAERLSPELATQLVIASMSKLPEAMPPHFSAMYTPIAAAGTHGQIKHVARLMATQFASAGVGTGGKSKKLLPLTKLVSMSEDDEIDATKSSVLNVVTGMMDDRDSKASRATLLPAGGPAKAPKQRIKTLKLSEVTKPLDGETSGRMLVSAVQRVMRTEGATGPTGVGLLRSKMITTMAATFDARVRHEVLGFLLEDVRARLDLALAWLYEEYSFMQGFSRVPGFLRRDVDPAGAYDELLCALARRLVDAKDSLVTRLYLEAPHITEGAVELLKQLCRDEGRSAVGLGLLQELVLRRPPRQLVFLNALLEHTSHENPQVRAKAIECVTELYGRSELHSIVEEYAIFYLSFLRFPQPPDLLFGLERGRPTKSEAWSDDIVRACLYLYMALLPVNEKLIHELARVYVQTSADVKRTILRLLEQPVRGMGMHSLELLRLVEECPKGAETLVTRVIHILTEKTPPSSELVERVRELYHTRVSDVRFLIPVLNGLTKKEVVAALPKLIKLNPVVVKEVFNRLLGTHSEYHSSPITPAELLIALHNIDPLKCELKMVIKATSLCFSDKQAYTQEVLAVVMQHLMEQSPLPTLLMRTVIQSLSLYPRLIGFVMNILQRLILKQVWTQKKVWEGFIKCCQRTQPQSFQVLLQLPALQLQDVFDSCSELQAPLLAHVEALTDNQRTHIPQSIMDVLMGKRRAMAEEYVLGADVMSPTELTIDMKDEVEDATLMAEPAPPGLE